MNQPRAKDLKAALRIASSYVNGRKQMSYQAQGRGGAAPAVAQLRSLADVDGVGGLRRIVETDLTPRMPFVVGAGWYDDYWYASRSESNWSRLGSALRRLCSGVTRAVESMCLAVRVRGGTGQYRPSRTVWR